MKTGRGTSKTVNGVTTTYQLDDTKIVAETTEDTTIWYIYDESGNVLSEYVYDAWGNIVAVYGDETIAQINPFRYRGYYQDNETGFYYLQSRYYDSETGRFLNADDTTYILLSENQIEYNIFTY